MRASTILVIIILLVSTFFITSCGKKPECVTNNDCATGNPCMSAKCTAGVCVKKMFDNCCGNMKCESMEDKCICDKDCGKCEGAYKYNISSRFSTKPTVVTTVYISQFCENEKCISGVPPDKITTVKLINDIVLGGAFKAELLTTINNPYVLDNSVVNIRLLLKDRDPNLVGNVTVSRIQILEGSEVLAEKVVDRKLAKISESWTDELEMVSSQTALEESKSIDIKFDYDYTIMVKVGTNATTKQPIMEPSHIIASMKNRLADKIMFVKLPE
jgi:hypothetical protein